jgi:L-ascorbate metabolism protein UlaG (beta-lactamase superfamily)
MAQSVEQAPPASAPDLSSGAVRLTYVGHATVLIEMDGMRLLTDPWLRARLGPLRRVPALPAPASYASLDAVLISHSHVDHLDAASLRLLAGTPRVIAAPGCRAVLARAGFTNVEELVPGEATTVGTVRVVATAAQHVNSRSATRAAGPSLGFVCVGQASVYFAGDTALFAGMRDLWPGIDVALIPVAGIGPRQPEHKHLGPLTAARALTLLRPKVAIPIHWGTMVVPGNRRLQAYSRQAGYHFARHAAEIAPDVHTIVLAPGETTEVRIWNGSGSTSLDATGRVG